MRFPWRAREYERTCGDCGYAWRVPRSAIRTRPIAGFSNAPRYRRRPMVGGLDPVVVGSAPEVTSSEEISEVETAFGHCPKCGSDQYTQRPVR
jgi:hypothetical protein